MPRRTLVLLLVSCSIVSCGLLARAQKIESGTAGPLVLKAVAPSTYPLIAIAAHVQGRVSVEVKIEPSGEVAFPKGIEGPALLASTAVAAARLWKFEPAPENSAERSARLIFVFQIASKKEDAQISFNPPDEVTYTFLPNSANVDTPNKKSRANQ